MEGFDGCKMGKGGDRVVKRTHSFFIDDLKIYQETHQKLQIVNEMIVKASMDTGACYGVKKCAEIVFRKGKMVKSEGLQVLEEKMNTLDPDKNEIYKFLGCKQGDGIDVKCVMERVKVEVRKRLEQLIGKQLNDENLMKAINCRIIPVAGYVMNVCTLGKGDLEDLDMIVKSVLRREGFHGRQSSDERLYTKRKVGGRGLKSIREVYDETKTRVACYTATSTNEWICAAWKSDMQKEHTSLKREAETVMRKVDARVIFDKGAVIISENRQTEWKAGSQTLKESLAEGQKRNDKGSFAEKRLQSEVPSQYEEEDHGWLKCNTDLRKTASIFAVQERMIETRAWKKIRGLIAEDMCRLCGEQRETVQHLLSGCKKLAGTEYLRRHDNTLKVWAVKWESECGLLSENFKWYREKWERGNYWKIMERNCIGTGSIGCGIAAQQEGQT